MGDITSDNSLNLTEDMLEPNDLKRRQYKGLMNSLIGKLSQKSSFPQTKYVTTPEEIDATFSNGNKKISDFLPISDDLCELVIEEETADSKRKPNRKTNPVLGAFVTALSRIDMHKQIMILVADGMVPMYTDTDSLVFFGPKNRAPPFKMTGNLGDFRKEYQSEAQSFCCIGKKNYAISFDREDRQRPVLKVCGISFKSEASQNAVSFEDFKNFLRDKIPPKIPQHRLYKKRSSVCDKIVAVKLATTLNYNRVLTTSPNCQTLPYGYISK